MAIGKFSLSVPLWRSLGWDQPRPALERYCSRSLSLFPTQGQTRIAGCQCLAFIFRSSKPPTVPECCSTALHAVPIGLGHTPTDTSNPNYELREKYQALFFFSHHAIKGILRSLAGMWGNESFPCDHMGVPTRAREMWKGRTVMMSDIDDCLDHQNLAPRDDQVCRAGGSSPLPLPIHDGFPA